MQDIDNRPGTARHEVSRLEDDRVAIAERRRNLPCRNGDREVPRRDDADDADRFAGDFDADARARRRQNFACQTQGFAGEEIENLAGADGFADALGQRLAFLTRQKTAKLVLARQNLVCGFTQDRMALQNAGTRPCRESGFRGGNGCVARA